MQTMKLVLSRASALISLLEARGLQTKGEEKCLQGEKKTVLAVSMVLKDVRLLLILKWLIQ